MERETSMKKKKIFIALLLIMSLIAMNAVVYADESDSEGDSPAPGVTVVSVESLKNSDYAKVNLTQWSSNNTSVVIAPGVMLTTRTGNGQWVLHFDETAIGEYSIYVHHGGGVASHVTLDVIGPAEWTIGNGGKSFDSINHIKFGYPEAPLVPVYELTVEKYVRDKEGALISGAGEFSFQILKDGKAFGSPITINTVDGKGEWNSLDAAMALEKGTYSVVELGVENANGTLTINGVDYTAVISAPVAVTDSKPAVVITVTNTPEPGTPPPSDEYSLSVVKDVKDADGAFIPFNGTFTFQLFAYNGNSEENEPYGDPFTIDTVEGTGSWSSVVPAGTYSVAEFDDEGDLFTSGTLTIDDVDYTVMVTYQVTLDDENLSGEIKVVNTPVDTPPEYGKIYVNKYVYGFDYDVSEDDYTGTFYFEIYDSEGEYLETVVVETYGGYGEGVTEFDYCKGTYTIVEVLSEDDTNTYITSMYVGFAEVIDGVLTIRGADIYVDVYNMISPGLLIRKAGAGSGFTNGTFDFIIYKQEYGNDEAIYWDEVDRVSVTTVNRMGSVFVPLPYGYYRVEETAGSASGYTVTILYGEISVNGRIIDDVFVNEAGVTEVTFTNNRGGGGDTTRTDRDPTPRGGTTTTDTPVILQDPDTPLADIPPEVILDADVPLADIPPTGMSSMYIWMTSVFAALGVALASRLRKTSKAK